MARTSGQSFYKQTQRDAESVFLKLQIVQYGMYRSVSYITILEVRLEE